MAVGFSIDFLWYQIGRGDFLHSFFSTICYRLEDGHWGEKYPYLMNNLYDGILDYQDVKYARKELEDVKERLKNFDPSKVVWDIDDLEQPLPWGVDISEDITDLSNYFVIYDGRDLISFIFEAFESAENMKEKIEVISL